VKRQILIVCAVALSIAGCGPVRSVVQNVTEPAAAAPTGPQPGQPITLSGTPRLSSPEPVPQSERRGQNWRRDLPRNIPYFNMSSDAIGIYDEAARTTQTNELLPGEGGWIETCDDEKPVCRMTFGNGRTGWVNMASMAGVAG
jgi:hypothetical protein